MNSNYEIHGIAAVVIFHAAITVWNEVVKPSYSMLKTNGGIKGIVSNIWRGEQPAQPIKP